MTVPITSINSAGGGSPSVSTVIPKIVADDLGGLKKGDQLIWKKTGRNWVPVKFIETK